MFRISANNEKNRSHLDGAKVTVFGAARSGVAAALLLAESGSQVLLSDAKNPEKLNLNLTELQEKGIRVETGGHSKSVLESDLICISPGLSLEIPILKSAVEMGIPIIGEIELASWFCKSPVIAITGSNGKTTTTTLSGNIFRTYNPETLVAGNIGEPFAARVLASTKQSVAILEISSFQLESIHNFHPKIAVLMNLTANHLDRYPDFEAYAAAKLNVLRNMTASDYLVYNRDDAYLQTVLSDVKPRKICFSLSGHSEEGAYWDNDRIVINLSGTKKELQLRHYQLRGPHNRYNMMVAALLAEIWEIPQHVVISQIENFPGIEHRLEAVREWNGVTFINDSKATTVDSLEFALRSFDEKLILIAGGKDKGGDFSQLSSLLRSKVRAAVLIGQAADRMERAWADSVPVIRAADLKVAVEAATKRAVNGDVVLLSPACSSFDMFNDYEHRGREFKRIVKGLK